METPVVNMKEHIEKLKQIVQKRIIVDEEYMDRAVVRMKTSLYGKFLGKEVPWINSRRS